jgi:hypothetical protein
MVRVVILFLAVLLSTCEARAATSHPITVGGSSMVAAGLDCRSVSQAVGEWAAATTVRSGPGAGDPIAWAPVSCAFNTSTGVATSVSVAVSRNRAVVYVGGPVVVGATDSWLDDPVDPAVFAAWFAFVFVTTVSFYLTVRGIGWIVDLLRY